MYELDLKKTSTPDSQATPPERRKSVKRKGGRFSVLKGGFVVVCVIILSTVVIHATDGINLDRDRLLGSASSSSSTSICPPNMAFVGSPSGGFCIDKFEASAGPECSYSNPEFSSQTQENLNTSSCQAVSEEGSAPWRYVARHQAELACVHAGKRLPTNEEWYRASLGTPQAYPGELSRECNLGSGEGLLATGSGADCISSSGAYDMIGNLWEWVEGDVVEGRYNGRSIPSSGFVTGVDSAGVAITTADNPDISFGGDYFWSEHDQEGVFGMIRGGHWGNNSDAGVYAINATVPPSFAGRGVGFRCAADPLR